MRKKARPSSLRVGSPVRTAVPIKLFEDAQPQSIAAVGGQVQARRQELGFTQDELARRANVSRTVVALLEQGRRLPVQSTVDRIVAALDLPSSALAHLSRPEEQLRLKFEQGLSELVGRSLRLEQLEPEAVAVARRAIYDLFHRDKTNEQAYDAFCSVLIFYDVPKPSRAFFERYLGVEALASPDKFEKCVETFQADAIRLFSTFSEAYQTLAPSTQLEAELSALLPRADANYRAREVWSSIERISPERLPDLGYISAARIRQEQDDRRALSTFLQELAHSLKTETPAVALAAHSARKRRRMSSLLRTLKSMIAHDFLSALFVPDPDELSREAARIAPKEESELVRIAETQAVGRRNLARYLTADHLDVYVATSMRTDADFASVNAFVEKLFAHDDVRPLRLRYFNPTQSWIEDRVAKGLVEALMLRRSAFSIYMAQKDDTFGKDSEASVALGQGKPVIVYVPRLFAADLDLDSAAVGAMKKEELLVQLRHEVEPNELDDTADEQALIGQYISARLERASAETLGKVAFAHWADFDLIGEAKREENEDLRSQYRTWMDDVIRAAGLLRVPDALRGTLIRILTALAVNFEKRAKVFREVHPLALQVILSSGVLNGILVARDVDSCASLLLGTVRNALSLRLESDENNCRLVETTTRSTIRVISRNQLIVNAFAAYRKDN